MATKDNSLLEIAVELLHKKRKPQNIYDVVEEVMSIKGLKKAESKERTPQFILDFMLSGYFVYCGDDTWDLKERQSLSILDKEGGDYEIYEYDEDVKKNELKDDTYGIDYIDDIDDVTDDADDEDAEEDEDDLTNEFDNATELISEEEEEEEDLESNRYTKVSKPRRKLSDEDEDDDFEEEDEE